MISRSRKFPMRTDFILFRRRANRMYTRFFTVYYFSSTISRLSVVVPKKVNKRATTRNWIKRIIYDRVWPVIKDQDLDVVVICKPIKLDKSSQTQKQIILEISQLKF